MWSVINTGLPDNALLSALAVDPTDPATVYAGTSGAGVFKTTDGGAHWGPSTTGLEYSAPWINALAVDPQTPTTIYAGTWEGVIRSVDAGARWAPLNASLTYGQVSALHISPSGACLHAIAQADAAHTVAVFDYATRPDACAPLTLAPLFAAVLPSSRSVQVGTPATAFATIINAAPSSAVGCGITPLTYLDAAFIFQTTDPVTNVLTGTANAPVDIPAGGLQTFVIAFTPGHPFVPTDASLIFTCDNSTPAPIQPGLNTLLVSGSTEPVPDIVALSATLNNDSIVDLPGPTGSGAFAVATVNVGAASPITATAVGFTGGDITLFPNLCQTNPTTGTCISAIGRSVTTMINANETPTFAVFVTGHGAIPFHPANNRVVVSFRDASGITRGSTSVAAPTE